MSRWRRAAKVDDNQRGIVEALNAIPGVGCAVGHDDVLVGYRGQTYWFEIKRPEAMRKDGTPRKGAIKPSQSTLKATWPGHYAIVSTLGEILREIGVEEHVLRSLDYLKDWENVIEECHQEEHDHA